MKLIRNHVVWGMVIRTDPMPSLDTPVEAGDFTAFLTSFQGFGLFVSGICTILVLLFFIHASVQFSLSAGEEGKRREALRGMLAAGAALALLGGIGILVGLFWNLFGIS